MRDKLYLQRNSLHELGFELGSCIIEASSQLLTIEHMLVICGFNSLLPVTDHQVFLLQQHFELAEVLLLGVQVRVVLLCECEELGGLVSPLISGI